MSGTGDEAPGDSGARAAGRAVIRSDVPAGAPGDRVTICGPVGERRDARGEPAATDSDQNRVDLRHLFENL